MTSVAERQTDGWFVILTRQHAEKRIMDDLAELKITAYAPMEKRLVRHARQTKAVERPLIPRYVFVLLDGDSDYHTVKTTEGVVDFLRKQNRKPAEVAHNDVMRVHLMEQLGDFDATPTTRAFAKGQPVKATAGKWQDYTLRFAAAKQDCRALVTMVMFGGKESRPFEVDARYLEAA